MRAILAVFMLLCAVHQASADVRCAEAINKFEEEMCNTALIIFRSKIVACRNRAQSMCDAYKRLILLFDAYLDAGRAYLNAQGQPKSDLWSNQIKARDAFLAELHKMQELELREILRNLPGPGLRI